MRAQRDVDGERGIALVVQHDGDLRLVAGVQEAWCRRPHHQAPTRLDRRLAGAEAILAGGRDGHHAIAREIVRERHVDDRPSIGVGLHARREHRERIEVASQRDLRPCGAGLCLSARRTELARDRLRLERHRRLALRLSHGATVHVCREARARRRALGNDASRPAVRLTLFVFRHEIDAVAEHRCVLVEVTPAGPTEVAGEHDGVLERDAIEQREPLHPGPGREERLHRIRDLVVGQRQHGLVHHDDGHVGVGDGVAVGVRDFEGDSGVAARHDLLVVGHDLHVQRLRFGRDGQ